MKASARSTICLTDKSGNIKAVVIGVGGFLGVGEHLVAVPFDKIKFVNEPVAYTGAASAPRGQQPAVVDHDHGCGTNDQRLRPRPRSPIPGIRITPCTTRPRMS